MDENVRTELLRLLKQEGYNVKIPPKGASDSKLASISLKENRIFITNDSDFADFNLYREKDLYALIWLRISQSEKEMLLSMTRRLLSSIHNFKGKMIILEEATWREFTLGTDYTLRRESN